MNVWWDTAQDLDACFHDNKERFSDWAASWTFKHTLWLHDMLWMMRRATQQLFLTLFSPNPFFALDWKVRWEGYRFFSCARCIWLCVVLSFCVSSCLMQAHAERREGDGSLCVCIHGKSTCLVLHSMLQTNERTEPVCVKSRDSIDLNMDLGGRWRIIHTSKATGQQSL